MTMDNTKDTQRPASPPSAGPASSAFLQRHPSGRLRIQATIRALFAWHESLSPGETAELFRYQICTQQALNALRSLRAQGFCMKIDGHGADGRWITYEAFKRQNEKGQL